ncbi:unnamed protein product [Echinostoma caproni]|uniref:Miff domain-containing protein n=1 Tax=Echinostoma caproni TaxID=27848 RepID=A0A183BB48_9TREM|nr:unnamed protein product [Echinostoma caproni]
MEPFSSLFDFSASANAVASDSQASATANAYAAASSPDLRTVARVASPIGSEKSMERMESQIAHLRRRVSSLEFQQNIVGTGLTLYVAFRILRWLLRALQ